MSNALVSPLARRRLSLDGEWQLWLDPDGRLAPAALVGKPARSALVPAPLQALGDDLRHYTGPAWYRRTVDVPADWLTGGALVLGFGAVDYFAEVWFNDTRIGQHEGGYLPFEFDVTAHAHAGSNTITVRVADPPELFAEIPHGKQSWYGPLSGLWQSVWLEARAPRHVLGLRLTPRGEQVAVALRLNHAPEPGDRFAYEILSPQGDVVARSDSGEPTATLAVPAPRLWDVDQPNLYTARATWHSRSGADSLAGTFGFRTIERRDGALDLNGRRLYLRGALDQDYYPDLICTPPSQEFLEAEFRKARGMGLNCLRVHLKVADPRYYRAADRAGLLVWTELPNWSRLTDAAIRRARETLAGMIERDWNHPSIIIWTLVNEAWGTELATNPEHCDWLGGFVDYAHQLDPTRLIVDNSACPPGFHVRSDVDDYHFYATLPDAVEQWDSWIRAYAERPAWLYSPHGAQVVPAPGGPAPEAGPPPLIVSEFGQWGLPDVGPLVDFHGGEPWWFETGADWGTGEVYPHGVTQRYTALHLDRVFGDYAGFARAAQWSEYEALKYAIESIRLQPAIAGYVLTELADVHWECNGLLTMLRRPKVFAAHMADLNADTLAIPRAARTSYWPGEPVTIDLHLSHVGAAALRGARVEWQLLGAGAGLAGALGPFDLAPGAVQGAGQAAFTAPEVSVPTRAQLEVLVCAADGAVLSRNHQALSLLPRPAVPAGPLACADEALAARLAALGCTFAEGGVRVLSRVDADARRFLQQGGRALFLAESPETLEVSLPRLELKRRQGSPWADWTAFTFTWFRRDRLGHVLPGDGRFDFAFAPITARTVIPPFGTREFQDEVLAGMAAGWLRRGAALIQKLPVGRGQVLVTTLRLREHLGNDPLATNLFFALLEEAAA